jgi:hypothetical protein
MADDARQLGHRRDITAATRVKLIFSQARLQVRRFAQG